jgi:hypothetical protein
MKMRSGIFLAVYLTTRLITLLAANTKNYEIYFFANYLKTDTSFTHYHLKVTPIMLSILPPSSGVQFYRDGIVFLSSSKYEEKILPEHLSFGTIYTRYAVLNDTLLGDQMPFSEASSFPVPSDAITFSSDFNIMYFTKFSDAEGTEKIFKANFTSGTGINGDWYVDSSYLSFCRDKYSYTHPALSFDGRIMVFSSNRTGSLGGLDLFLSRNIGGVWSFPENLGDSINTDSDELFAFLDSENNLYFSSNGLRGLGGYDVYLCKYNGLNWNKPVNLQGPVNTKLDDVAFKINRNDPESALYTVRQRSGKKSVELYNVCISRKSTEVNISNLSQLFIASIPELRKKQGIISAPAALPDIFKNEIQVSEKPIKSEEVSEIKTVIPSQVIVKTSETDIKQDASIPEIKDEPKIAKVEPVKVVPFESPGKTDIVVFRVQLLSSDKSKGSYQIKINGKIFNSYEYFYKGAFRTCVGEFSSVRAASEFEKICRASGHPQAFVVAFVNNERSIDPALFKK